MKVAMRGFFFLKNIRGKLFAIITVILLVLLMVYFAVFYSEVKTTFQEQFSSLMINDINRAMETIESNLIFFEQVGFNIMYQQDFVNAMKDLQDEIRRGKEISPELIERLRRVLISQPPTYLAQFEYYGLHEIRLCINDTSIEISTNPQNQNMNASELFRAMDTSTRSLHQKAWRSNDSFRGLSNVQQGSVLRFEPIEATVTRPSGLLAFVIDGYYFRDHFNEKITGEGSQALVLSKEDVLITYHDEALVGTLPPEFVLLNQRLNSSTERTGSFDYDLDGMNFLAVYSKSPYTGWKYVRLLPMNVLEKAMFDVPRITFYVLLVLLCALVGTWMFTGFFYKPIRCIVLAMKHVEKGDFKQKITEVRSDEFMEVYNGFNTMTREIKNLLDNLTDERIVNQELQIKFLQSQINPHFLYNTLNSMYAIASIHNVDELSQMIMMLSRFYKNRLGKGMQESTLSTAVELANDYVAIQNIRFNGKISYNCSIPTELLGCIVPALLIQPIVENAIFHGIEPSAHRGIVHVEAYTREDFLYICIRDNGVGMDEQTVLALNIAVHEVSEETRFTGALNNIDQLLKMKYGASSGLEIASIKNEGTLVRVKIPRQFL